jgi:hypothetical protein
MTGRPQVVQDDAQSPFKHAWLETPARVNKQALQFEAGAIPCVNVFLRISRAAHDLHSSIEITQAESNLSTGMFGCLFLQS